MSRLTVSIIILILCFTSSLGQHKFVDSYFQELYENLEESKEYLLTESNKKAEEKLSLVTKDFETKSKILRVILGDDTLTSLEVTLPLITPYIDNGDIEEALDTVYSCQAMAQEIRVNKSISLYNVF